MIVPDLRLVGVDRVDPPQQEPRPASAATAPGVRPAPELPSGGAVTIMLIRHGEKQTGSGPPYSIDSACRKDPASLSVLGWTRVGALAALFDPASGLVRTGLTRPTALFAAKPIASSRRPLETITPLGQRLGMQVHTPEEPDRTAAIAAILSSTGGVQLAAWQHEHIPAIAAHLGSVSPAIPAKWPGDRYDIVWVFTRQAAGTWAFTQVPQLLLSGDKSRVIS